MMETQIEACDAFIINELQTQKDPISKEDLINSCLRKFPLLNKSFVEGRVFTITVSLNRFNLLFSFVKEGKEYFYKNKRFKQ